MPTQEELQRERAIFFSFFYDCLLLPPFLWVALKGSSLTMLAELMRGVPLVTIAIISYFTLRKIHRRKTGNYDFGMGKVEQVLSLFVGLLLVASMAFVWYKSMSRTDVKPPEIATLNLLTVGLAFLNLGANAAPLLPLRRALKSGRSVLVTTLFRTKLAKTIGSVVVTVSVTINQLSSDPVWSTRADQVGILIVTIVTLHAAYELLKSAVPDLLDRTLPEHHQARINQVLATHYDDFDTLKWCRSRQSGSNIEVHVGLGFAADMRFGDVARISQAVTNSIESTIPGSIATVTPVLAA